jgi:hypothetical protein
MRNFRPCLYFWKPSMDHATHSSAAIRQKLPRMTQIMGLTRWFSVVVVLSSLVGALLMFVIGASNTAEAVLQYLEMMPVLEGAADAAPVGKQASPRVAANLQLLESLDNGLTALAESGKHRLTEEDPDGGGGRPARHHVRAGAR